MDNQENISFASPDTELINYDNQGKTRIFTILKLEIRALTFWDSFILLLLAAAIGTHFVITKQNPQHRFYGLIGIPFITYVVTTTTPLGLRFRSVYFFAIWLILCLIFLLAGTSLSLLPLASFILYQTIRLLFWRNYNKEFIPFQLVRAPISFSKKAFLLTFIRVVSKVEGRGGYREDKQYMGWLVRLGFCLFMLCLYSIVGVHF